MNPGLLAAGAGLAAAVGAAVVLDANMLWFVGALAAAVTSIVAALKWLDKRILEKVRAVVREMKLEARLQREKERLHTYLILNDLRALRMMITGKDEPRLDLPGMEPEPAAESEEET